jgi:hypothetical protein
MKPRHVWAVLLLVPVGALGYGCASDRLLESRFLGVKRGEAEALVVASLGTPYRISGPPEYVAWGGDPVRPNSGDCVRLFWYRPIVNVADEEYTVGFDANGNVVSKYHYISQ